MSETPHTREEILTAAERVIAQLGVKHLTIEQVAKAAGVSRGGLLYHFASKEALIQGMRTRFIERFEFLLEEDLTRSAASLKLLSFEQHSALNIAS